MKNPLYLAGLLFCATAPAADIVWTNTASGNWTVAANWSPNQVPGTNDFAWITNNGNYTVTLDANVTLSGLALGGDSGTQTLSHANYTLSLNGTGLSSFHGAYTLAGGILTGSGALILYGPFNWSGGSVGSASSALVVTANGGLTISGGTKYLYTSLVNNGAATWSAGTAYCYGLFNNTLAATLDLAADGSPFVVGGGTPLFANAGTLRKTAGTGSATVGIPFANTGLVQVNSGTLALTLTNSSGGFTAASGATLSVNGTATLAPDASITGAGNFTVAGGSLFTNHGAFNVSGTNTFTGGTAVFTGACTITNNTLVVNGGSVMLNGTGTVAPAFLTVSQGTLQGSQAVTVSGPFLWSGGTLGSANSATAVTANGGLTINAAAVFLYGALVNNGAGVWNAGQTICYGTALFSNTPAATLDLTADGASFSVAGGSPSFANAGTLRKTAGTGTTTLSVPCANTGSVQVNSGTLALTLADGTGSFTTATGTTLKVLGTATLAPGASIMGGGNFTVSGGAITNHGTLNVSGTNIFTGGTAVFAGNCTIANNTLVVSGGTVSLNGSGTVAPAFLNVSDGTLQGSQAVTVSGPFVWSGGVLGNLSFNQQVTANGGLTLNGTAKSLYATLINNGAGTWSAGMVNCYGTALFSNALAATLDFAADGIAIHLNSGNPRFANAGTLRKTAGAGTTTVTLPCANSGSVQANSGTLALTLADSAGSFTAASGATLNLSGTATLASDSTITGSGNFTVSGGAITNHGALNVSGTNSFSGGTAVFAGSCTITNNALIVSGGVVSLNGSGLVAPVFLVVSSGTLQGSQAVTVSGPFVWSGGALGSASSAAAVTANGGLTMNGTIKYLYGTLANNSAGTWSAGGISCYGTALFSNTPAATLDLTADGTLIYLYSSSGLLANAGSLRKTAGTGATLVSMPCANSGSVQASSGILNFGDSFVQTAGQTILNGGNFIFQKPAQLRGGTLSGSGTITGSVSNNATLSPGTSPGLLSITGNYTEGANAHLNIELGGTTPGTGHDQLSVGGVARLAGTLEVTYWNGYTLAAGNVFTTLVCSARSGVFSSVQVPTNSLGVIYTSKAVLLEPGNASPSANLTVNPVQTVCRSFRVQGSATDADGSVTNISLLLDTNILASVSAASAQVTVSYDFPGDVTLTALATDNKGAMGATNVIVNFATLPVSVLDPIGFQTNRAFKLCMEGVAGTTNRIEANDDLSSTNWTDLGAMENTNGIWRFSDKTATNSTHRYYRARQLP